MMNTWTHFFAALALLLTATIIHAMIRLDNNTKALDVQRFYTMKRVVGDLDGAKAIVDDDSRWPIAACQAALNSSNPSDSCVTARRALRDAILFRMNCFTYNSQVCMYMRNITAGIVQNRTSGGSTLYVGRSLAGVIPGQTSLTYRQLLRSAIEKAPLLFHPSYKAAQADDFYVLRTGLYNLIIFSIFANLLVHIADQWEMTWTSRLITRISIFTLFTLLPTCLFLIGALASFSTLIVAIWLPSLIVLIYYELLLDQSISRPWVHPYAFALIYASLSVLALTENAVLNWSIVLVTIFMSHAVSHLYMQIVWYWVGYNEKRTHDPASSSLAYDLYHTKEIQYALFLAIIMMGVIPMIQAIGPYDYDSSDLLIRGAPLVFVTLGVWGTLYLQSMQLSDYYGKDSKAEPSTDEMSARHLLTYRATRITAGKLAVSLLLIIFGVLYEFNIIGIYFRTLRAYNDKLPERAWQLDTASRFTLGTGFLPAPTLYL